MARRQGVTLRGLTVEHVHQFFQERYGDEGDGIVRRVLAALLPVAPLLH